MFCAPAPSSVAAKRRVTAIREFGQVLVSAHALLCWIQPMRVGKTLFAALSTHRPNPLAARPWLLAHESRCVSACLLRSASAAGTTSAQSSESIQPPPQSKPQPWQSAEFPRPRQRRFLCRRALARRDVVNGAPIAGSACEHPERSRAQPVRPPSSGAPRRSMTPAACAAPRA